MKIRWDSLRFRLLFGTVIWIGLGIVVGGLLVSSLFRWNLLNGYHDELAVHIEELSALTTVDDRGQPFLHRRLSDPRFLPVDSGFYWQVDRAGFEAVTSPSLGERRLDPAFARDAVLHTGWRDGPTGRMLEYGKQVSLPDGPPLRLLIATDKRLIDATMAEFNLSLILSLAGFAVLMISIGALQVWYGLKPLDQLGRAIGDVRSGRASRMKGVFPSEIMPLVSDLNGLIESGSEAVTRSRLIAGNLAHGLRTPLSILIDEADRLRKTGHVDEAQTILEEARIMQRQIDFHLARARQAAAQPIPGQVVRLGPTLERLVDAFGRLYRHRPIEFGLEPGEDVNVTCDPVDLTETLSNLLDNAGKWSATRCVVRWRRDGDEVVIEIEDDGPGLPEEARAAVFKAGTRLDDLTPGSGLGLAISRDLAKIYGGKLVLERATTGGVLAVLRLPIA